jgi:hypothetical protein
VPTVGPRITTNLAASVASTQCAVLPGGAIQFANNIATTTNEMLTKKSDRSHVRVAESQILRRRRFDWNLHVDTRKPIATRVAAIHRT